MSRRPLTTTSYAILGLLAIQPWATYDLAKLMRRSLHFFWPRAESNLYAEPKRLVEAGLAEVHEEWNGDRRRTVYSITDRGREALGTWLASQPAAPRLESEPHLRLLFANYGAKDDLLGTIAGSRPMRRGRSSTTRRWGPSTHAAKGSSRTAST